MLLCLSRPPLPALFTRLVSRLQDPSTLTISPASLSHSLDDSSILALILRIITQP